MYYLGIDWADDKHDVCLLAETGQILSQFVIGHNWSGFQTLAETLDALPDVKINIERRDGLLIDWLVERGADIFVMHPHALAARRPRRSKHDQSDAYLLAHLLRLDDLECRPLIVQSPIVEHLKQLVIAYDRLMQEQRRLGNQLVFYLKQYYPIAIDLFSSPVRHLIALDFVEQFPTPQLAQSLTLTDLQAFLASHHYRYMERLPQLYQHLQQPIPIARVQTGWVEHVKCLIPLLRYLIHSKTAIQRQITTVFKTHPDASFWQSLPGVGPLTAARLLAHIGDNRDRFPSAMVLQAIAGTAPITRSSGKHLAVEFRRACSHPLRAATDDLARLSVRESGWAAACFNEQLARGHAKPRAYRALANRWMRIIWKCWTTGEPYDEVKHVMNRAKQGRQSLRIA
ncbi:MAG: IS110 family transposase [Chloroflexi bacterium]|nr:IS110 family transposase [Chloroflexota bacterium]